MFVLFHSYIIPWQVPRYLLPYKRHVQGWKMCCNSFKYHPPTTSNKTHIIVFRPNFTLAPFLENYREFQSVHLRFGCCFFSFGCFLWGGSRSKAFATVRTSTWPTLRIDKHAGKELQRCVTTSLVHQSKNGFTTNHQNSRYYTPRSLTNIAPENLQSQKERIVFVFKPSFFRGDVS